MATRIRPELSENNKYWISKHRYYELKHFCLQYPIWKKTYNDIDRTVIPVSIGEYFPTSNMHSDLTCKFALMKSQYASKIKMIENAAKESDLYLADYIIKAVTEGYSYNYLRSTLNIPCGRDTYYNRYRKFFWILSNNRD